MTEQKDRKLNRLERTLPQGLLVDASWMERHGYSTSLRSQYVSAGWLIQPARGTFKRPLGELSWQGVVVSLQRLLGSDFVVGGRTAIEAQGLGHYLSQTGPSTIHLYGTRPAPGWLAKLPLKQKFRVHRTQSLFKAHASPPGLKSGTTYRRRSTGLSRSQRPNVRFSSCLTNYPATKVSIRSMRCRKA
ncbi:hypothetical protein ACVMII_009891 [Bradyrhizobium diazoefficiens]